MNTGGHAPDDEVRTLKRMVDRHVVIPHEFVCISENKIDGVDTVKPINDMPGWWGKINLFAPTVSRKRNLWLDLDVTITNELCALYMPIMQAQLRICKNWAASDLGSCQSSVMYWEGNSAQIIYDTFDHADATWPPVHTAWSKGHPQCGDQEWITVLRDANKIEVEYFYPLDVVSYKYHCQRGVPELSAVQVFHGRPNPKDCSEQWIRDARA